MNVKIKLPLFLTTGMALFSMSASERDQAPEEQPHIILIMSDDMGYSDLGCYGSVNIQTPNIDRLAQDGVRFTQFYNGARCCPTRATLLTGLYAHQTGIGHMVGTNNDKPGHDGVLNDKNVTIAEVLKTQGYYNYMLGKWHVAPHKDKKNWPLERGFDQRYGTLGGGGNYYNPNGLNRNDTLLEPPEDFYYTDAISRQAVRNIQEHTSQRKQDPFFMYVAYTSPHWPLHVPDSTIEKYKGKFDAGWDQIREQRLARMKDMGIIDPDWKLSERNPEVPAWEDAENKDWYKRRMEVYAAQIDHM